MGRSTGWIAVEAGIAGGADQVLIPERPLSLESIYDRLRVRHETHGRNYSILMVAEGFRDVEDELDPSSGSTDHLGRVRYAGVGAQLALRISADLGYNARCTTLGYLQRSADRILASRLSDRAYDLLQGGESGVMAGLVGDDIESVPLSRVAGETKTVPEELIALADVFG
jgi:6-phosphofructokinase 1